MLNQPISYIHTVTSQRHLVKRQWVNTIKAVGGSTEKMIAYIAVWKQMFRSLVTPGGWDLQTPMKMSQLYKLRNSCLSNFTVFSVPWPLDEASKPLTTGGLKAVVKNEFYINSYSRKELSMKARMWTAEQQKEKSHKCCNWCLTAFRFSYWLSWRKKTDTVSIIPVSSFWWKLNKAGTSKGMMATW